MNEKEVTKSTRMAIRCTEDMKANLEEMAKKKQITMSALVTQYLADGLLSDKKRMELIDKMDLNLIKDILGQNLSLDMLSSKK